MEVRFIYVPPRLPHLPSQREPEYSVDRSRSSRSRTLACSHATVLNLRCVSGLVNCVAPMVLSETCPYKYRGAFGTVHQLSVTIGIFVSSVFGLPQIMGELDSLC